MDDTEREVLTELEHDLRDLEAQAASIRRRISLVLNPAPRPKTILFTDPYHPRRKPISVKLK